MKNSETKNVVSEIPYKRLIQMHNRYLKKSHGVLTKSKKIKDDTKSIWFEKNADLEGFLSAFLKSDASGLRVYICEYDKDTVPKNSKIPDYINKLTVGFIATKKGRTTHIDDVKETKMLILDPYNHGKICPPDICPEEEGNPMKQ